MPDNLGENQEKYSQKSSEQEDVRIFLMSGKPRPATTI